MVLLRTVQVLTRLPTRVGLLARLRGKDLDARIGAKPHEIG